MDVQEVFRTLGRVEAKLDNVEKKLDALHSELLIEKLPEIDKRLDSLETTRNYGLGGLGMVGALTTLAATVGWWFGIHK